MKSTIRIVLLSMLVISLLALCEQGCKLDPKVEEVEEEIKSTPAIKTVSSNYNLNISILIDLSDRINPEKYPAPAMEFYQRDIGYVESVAQSFKWHLLTKKVIRIDDKIQVFIDPEPSDQNLNMKIGGLKTHFMKSSVIKDSILKVPEKYRSISRLIYESAIEDNHYIGSNIWGFLKSKVDDYCIDEGYRNILVILTDGYMFHKDAKMESGNRTSYLVPELVRSNSLNDSDWQERMNQRDLGFITANKDLSNLEILVLGINPAIGNPYEEDVIRTYWSKWFDEMKVKSYEIKQADLPTHMDKIIRDFILKE